MLHVASRLSTLKPTTTLKVPADETPLDIEAIIRFSNSVHLSPTWIRESIKETLSWQKQMQCVIEETLK